MKDLVLAIAIAAIVAGAALLAWPVAQAIPPMTILPNTRCFPYGTMSEFGRSVFVAEKWSLGCGDHWRIETVET